MLRSLACFRQWLVQVQSFVIRQVAQLFNYLGEMDAPSRLIVILLMIVVCYLTFEGGRAKSAC